LIKIILASFFLVTATSTGQSKTATTATVVVLPDDRDVKCTAEIYRAVSLKNGAHFTLRDGAVTVGKGEILKMNVAPGADSSAFIAQAGEAVQCNVHLTQAITKPLKFALATKSGKKIGSGVVRWMQFKGPELYRPLADRCFSNDDHMYEKFSFLEQNLMRPAYSSHGLMRRYKYTFCPFRNVSRSAVQVHAHDEQQSESLGIFDTGGFVDDAQVSHMHFVGPKWCNKGSKDLNVVVVFGCGATYQLSSFVQPQKCMHTATFLCPEACALPTPTLTTAQANMNRLSSRYLPISVKKAGDVASALARCSDSHLVNTPECMQTMRAVREAFAALLPPLRK
jgi:hypothetical protein